MSPNLNLYVASVDVLQDKLGTQKKGLEAVKSSLSVLGNFVDAVKRAAKDADEVKLVANDLRYVAKIMKLFPPSKALGTTLDKLLDQVADKADEISKLLKSHSTKLDVFGKAISVAKLTTQGFLADVLNDLGDLNATEASLKDLQAAIAEDPAGLDPKTQAGIAAMEAVFAELIAKFPEQALEEATSAVQSMETALAPYGAMAASMSEVLGGLGAVNGMLSGIGDPLSKVTDALDPLLWVLDKADAVIDAVVGPVLDPIMDAIGIDKLLDHVDKLIGGAFPDIALLDPLNGMSADFPTIFGSEPDFEQPMTTRIKAAYGARDDLPGTDPKAFLASRLFGEKGFIAELLNTDGHTGTDVMLGRNDLIFWRSDLSGNAGSDVLSAGIGDDTLTGGLNDDIFINASGDDSILGGAGFDALFTLAPLSEFSFQAETKGSGTTEEKILYLTHLGGLLGLGNFGADTISNVESFVFGQTVVTYDQLSTALVVDYAQSNERNGTPDGDLIIGGDQADILRGLGGDDILIASAGGDTLDGGSGTDTVDYSGYPGGAVRAALSAADQARLGNMSDELSGIENLLGSQYDDLLVGDHQDNRLNGGRGADTIAGQAGADVLVLGRGDANYVIGGTGHDTIEAAFGQTRALAGTGNDRYVFGDQNAADLIFYALRDTPLLGGVSATSLSALTNADPSNEIPYRIVYSGNQTATATVKKYSQSGVLVGTDSVQSNAGNIIGTDRNDAFTLGPYFALFDGGAGHDSFTGSTYNLRDRTPDSLDVPEGLRAFGGAGSDTFTTYTTEESFVGGSGNDRYVFLEDRDAPSDLSAPTDDRQVSYFFGGDAPTSFGQMTGTYDAELDRMVYAPTALGSFDAGALADDGVDTLDLSHAVRYWLIDMPNGLATSKDYIGPDGIAPFGATDNRIRFFGVETVLTGPMNDWLVHGDTNLIFWAGEGRDTILPGLNGGLGNLEAHGGQGDDSFTAGLGVDTLYGDAGNDFLRNDGNQSNQALQREHLYGGDGNDFLTVGSSARNYSGVLTDFHGGAGQDFGEFYLGSSDAIQVFIGDGTYDLNGFGGAFDGMEGVIIHDATALISGAANADAVQTGDGDDTLYGAGGNDILVSGKGVDRLFGGEGNDILAPGPGSGYVDGGPGTDTLMLHGRLDYIAGQGVSLRDSLRNSENWLLDLGTASLTSGSDRVNYSRIERFVGGWGDDTMIGAYTNDYFDGHGGDDSLDGSSGHDTLIAGAGDDTLKGGIGDDVLAMGTGYDQFFGGPGFDTLQADGAMDDVVLRGLMGQITGSVTTAYEVAPGVGIYTYVTEIAATTFDGIEGFVLSRGNDDGEGSEYSETISGGLGDDTLRGLGGGDTLLGGEGDDLLIGGGISDLPRMVRIDQSSGLSGLRIDAFDQMPTQSLTVEMMVQAEPPVQKYTLMSYAVAGSTNEFTIIVDPSRTWLEVIVNGKSNVTGVSFFDLYDSPHRLSVTWSSSGLIAI
ncbi:hypothetical protein [Pseudoprimorskyibacter insulae]|uniref:Bifunctional hemolysin/adenylate cyclase n=1 Tax=Pseudoprimorskyibacter insulae TaxID=1695997 RepID=A0A2R8ARJ3_9RHOB|nr:hypothetical protein [Pseudoprimorskyibacter insulae]SPF78507.1 Bifunctional hemolysin/adenylate cyclase [Pseudoprimorskyibacter insulae]